MSHLHDTRRRTNDSHHAQEVHKQLTEFTEDTKDGFPAVLWAFIDKLSRKHDFPASFPADVKSRQELHVQVKNHDLDEGGCMPDEPFLWVNIELPKILYQTVIEFDVVHGDTRYKYRAEMVELEKKKNLGNLPSHWYFSASTRSGHPHSAIWHELQEFFVIFENPLESFFKSVDTKIVVGHMLEGVQCDSKERPFPLFTERKNHEMEKAVIMVRRSALEAVQNGARMEWQAYTMLGSKYIVTLPSNSQLHTGLPRTGNHDPGFVSPLIWTISVKQAGKTCDDEELEEHSPACPWMKTAQFQLVDIHEFYKEGQRVCFSLAIENILKQFLQQNSAVSSVPFLATQIRNPKLEHADLFNGLLRIKILEGVVMSNLSPRNFALNVEGYGYFFQVVDRRKTDMWIVQKLNHENPHWPSWLKTILIQIDESQPGDPTKWTHYQGDDLAKDAHQKWVEEREKATILRDQLHWDEKERRRAEEQ
ncbi:hypothetical protein T439DRAFT_355939 [Meredithblackwellia eburnea MCA 4105]